MEKIDFTNPDYEFDDIAEQVFYPIYDVIAQDLLEETGIVSGSMLDVGCGGGHLGFAVMGKSDLTGDFVDINATAVRRADVNTMNCDGKVKRRGTTFGRTAASKKASVKLTEDSKEIEIFQGL